MPLTGIAKEDLMEIVHPRGGKLCVERSRLPEHLGAHYRRPPPCVAEDSITHAVAVRKKQIS